MKTMVDRLKVRLYYADDERGILGNTRARSGDPATGGWNREHSFPHSFFNSVEPMQSDMHALLPSNGDINLTRNNCPYEVVTIPTSTEVFGNEEDTVNDFFEPIDDVRGDAARAVFYMDIRHEGENSGPDLFISDVPSPGSGGNRMAFLTTLLQWHNDDPPDTWEITRNNRVYNEQGNANPFIDHPGWVPIIHSSTPPSVTNSDTITVASSGSLSSSVR
jgi:endonuclease I